MPPVGIVIGQVSPDDPGQFPQTTGTWLAVSKTEAPTLKVATHVPPVAVQLIAAGRLVTVPRPTTPTANVASLPPPGQRLLLGSSTVTVASAITTLPEPPVPSGTLAEISATPQGPGVPCGEPAGGGVAVNTPGDIKVATPLSIFQVA